MLQEPPQIINFLLQIYGVDQLAIGAEDKNEILCVILLAKEEGVLLEHEGNWTTVTRDGYLVVLKVGHLCHLFDLLNEIEAINSVAFVIKSLNV